MSLEDRPRITISFCGGGVCPTRMQEYDGFQAMNSNNVLRLLLGRVETFQIRDQQKKEAWADLDELIELTGLTKQLVTTALIRIRIMGCSRACITGGSLPKTEISVENFPHIDRGVEVIKIIECKNAEEAVNMVVRRVSVIASELNAAL